MFIQKKIRMLLPFLLLIAGSPVFAQTLSEVSLTKIKKATVYVNVKHQFLLTNEDISTSGSGFFINDRGLIATNYHVIQSSLSDYKTLYPTRIKEIKIYLNSGSADYKKYTARIISIDKKNDLAILAVSDSVKFPFLEVDISKLIELKPVWVFGYPFGEEFAVMQRGPEVTVSNGAISALRHDDLNVLNRIQVDAVINHGNSGGPVVNEQGKVVGIINSMMGSSRINFAIPAHFLVKMTGELPSDFSADKNTAVNIRVIPDDASVFVDGKPLVKDSRNECTLPNGLHEVCVMKKGFVSCIKEVTFCGNYTDTIRLFSGSGFSIPAHSETEAETVPPVVTVHHASDVLLKEEFSDADRFKKWEQNTGGEPTRTWFIEEGELRQFENNSMLHAIYLGDRSWDNYTVNAKVKISSEGGEPNADSRAGIIFRETEEGFYLLRIHKESNKAQLAYHSNGPFGWFIIKEKKLDKDIVDGKWYGLSASVHGNNISCAMDGVNLFAVNASYSPAGRVGFYSVDSKPGFDSLTVTRVNNIDMKGVPAEPSLISFWFSDNFNLKSNWWYQYKLKEEREELNPVYMIDGAFAVSDENDFVQGMEFAKYDIKDFVFNLSVSVDTGKADASFEVFVRKTDKGRISVRFNKKEKSMMLLQYANGKEKILKERKLPFGVFGSTASIQIKTEGNSVYVGSAYSEWIRYENKSIPADAGRIGFSSKDVRLAFHELTITSISPKVKGKK